MVSYREPDGLEKTTMILTSLWNEVIVEAKRRRALIYQIIIFAALFIALVTGETLFATMMFSIIQIEILGTAFSGAAFAMLVPTVIGYAHVRLHHEADHFLRWWLKTLSGIGVLIFAIGMSLMIGFSAWEAMQDVFGAIASGPTGEMPGQLVDAGTEPSSGIVEWIGVIPTSLLFLGLSFGMIITISFASFCLGRVLEAFNILTLTPRIEGVVKQLITSAIGKATDYRKLRDQDASARLKLPFDVKAKFAREGAYAGWKVGQSKLQAARRLFGAAAKNDPLNAIVQDPAAGTIPSRFKTEDQFIRHMAEQMDAMRIHNILRVVAGTNDGRDQI